MNKNTAPTAEFSPAKIANEEQSSQNGHNQTKRQSALLNVRLYQHPPSTHMDINPLILNNK